MLLKFFFLQYFGYNSVFVSENFKYRTEVNIVVIVDGLFPGTGGLNQIRCNRDNGIYYKTITDLEACRHHILHSN